MTRLAQAVRSELTSHLPELRAALEEQRSFRVEQLAELATAATARPAPATDAAGDPITVALRAGAEAALTDIEAALRRIEGGSYGTCRHCDTPIPLERLEILPMVERCTRCQHAHENRRTWSAAALRPTR